jgi:hypothetical protein
LWFQNVLLKPVVVVVVVVEMLDALLTSTPGQVGHPQNMRKPS